MNIDVNLSHLFHSQIFLTTAMMLIMLACIIPSFCGEIHDAAEAGDPAKVKTLLKDNPKLVFSKENRLGETPLHVAAEHGHKGVAELLLANGADVNAKDNDGWTPLHDAAMEDRKDVIELLLANKAKINVKDKHGYTPLHWAAHYGYKDAVELLLANKADINARNHNGETPLHLASAVGYEDIVKLLRRHGGHE
jgi:ankyrin repeat protein